MSTNSLIGIVLLLLGVPTVLLILRSFGKVADIKAAKKLITDLANAAGANDGKIDKVIADTKAKNDKIDAKLAADKAEAAKAAKADKEADSVEVANRIIRAATKSGGSTK